MPENQRIPLTGEPQEHSNTEAAAHRPQSQATRKRHSDRPWQHRLLPVMVAMIVGLTLFFFAATLFQLYTLRDSIAQSPSLDLSSALMMGEQSEGKQAAVTLAERRWKTLALLEEHVIKQRYHQANVLLMARVWVRYLGFVTGMILALVGAVFVLGKIREERTDLGLQHKDLKGTLSTTSPGLVLATLGSILMLATLVTHHNIDVADGPLYVTLPYAGIRLPARPQAPEDVTQLTPLPDKQQQNGSSQQESSPESHNNAQQRLDDTFNEIDRLFNQSTR